MASPVFVIEFLKAQLFALPIYIANAAPSIFGGGLPVDFYHNFKDGKRIFGDHKTWRGLIAGIVSGTLTGILIWWICEGKIFSEYPWFLGLLMSFSDQIADLSGSFIKRRINIQPGGSLPVYDQLSWLGIGLLVSWPFVPSIPWYYYVMLMIPAPLVHIGSSFLAYKLGFKEVWW
ncbi:MAG: CDP-2,3-bis-(O-geranylgeranyl)-sn-glycerol synthase [Candidatus Heimdallarchaeaceae archaeon]